MAEALMTDVDQFLHGLGLPFTRYVDDIRVFSDDVEELDSTLRELTIYLYENHRLTLASGKTKIMEAEKYVSEHIHNPYNFEKDDIFESLEVFNPYRDQFEEDLEDLDELDVNEEAEEAFLFAFETAINKKSLDVGLSKGIIRRARMMRSSVLVAPILEHFDFFLPVVSDAMIYINQIAEDEGMTVYNTEYEGICDSNAMKNPLARYWMEWFVAQHRGLLLLPKSQALINTSTNIENQALAAVTNNNIAWVRSMKAQIYNTSARGRRAILFSTKILPSDERNHWLRMTIGSTLFPIDKWVAKWILDTTE